GVQTCALPISACALRPNLQHLDRQTILEIDLCRLRRGMATETRAAVMGMPLEIKAVAEGSNDFGLARAGQACHQLQRTIAHGLIEGVDKKPPHGLVAADYPRIFHPGLGQPLLHQLRAQATAETIQIAIGMRLSEGLPG